MRREKAEKKTERENHATSDSAPRGPHVASKLWFVRWVKTRPEGPLRKSALLAQTKSFHNLAIPIRVATIQIVQQPAALVDHHDQSAA